MRLEGEGTESSSEVLWLRVDTNGQQNARPHFTEGRRVAIRLNPFVMNEVFFIKVNKYTL